MQPQCNKYKFLPSLPTSNRSTYFEILKGFGGFGEENVKSENEKLNIIIITTPIIITIIIIIKFFYD